MLSLNKNSNEIFMQLLDHLGNEKSLSITNEGKGQLTLQLVATEITINSRKIISNLYCLFVSNTPDGNTQKPGMKFLIVDTRKVKSDANTLKIYPVSYRNDEINTNSVGVYILNSSVHEVNRNWQREYCKYANHWLKKLLQLGYLQNLAAEEKKDNTDNFNSHPKLNCLQSLIEMSHAEKAKLLHILYPDVIRAFIAFVNDKAINVINGTETISEEWENEKMTKDGWIELARIATEKVTSSFNRLVDDSDFFAYELFTGYHQILILHCLQEYMTECPNERFVRGIHFIFDL